MIRFRDIPLWLKMLLLFLCIFLPSLGAIAYFTYQYSVNVIEKNINQYSLQTLREIQQNISYVMEDVENISRFLLYDNQIQETLTTPIRDLPRDEEQKTTDILFNLANQKNYINMIHLFGRNGYSYVYGESNQRLTDMESIKNEEWYQDAMRQDGMYKWYAIDDPELINTSNSAQIALIRAINNKRNYEPIGSVSVFIDPDFFSQSFQRIQFGQTGHFFIINEHNKMIISERLENDTHPDVALQLQKINSTSGYDIFQIEGERYVLLHESFNNLPWKLIGLVPLNELNSDALYLRNFIVQTAFISVVLLIFISFLISRGITNSISQLIQTMRRTQHGDFSLELRADRKDEIGMLIVTYNNMIQKINHLVNQVYHADLQTKEAEFRALQAQINPHFLYNTLDSIHWLALTRGDETISKMVTALSKLFRYTLSRNDGLITIREEIEHVRNYITIQEFRFKDRFKVWIDVDERLLPCKIVKLVVQPLVENAIVHGIERLTDGGLIALRVYEHNETIYIDVSDNGPGADLNQMQELLERGNQSGLPARGYGVQNVHQRIKLAFGNDYGLNYEQILNGGTRVTIKIPKLTI